jgi:hypothetical protein
LIIASIESNGIITESYELNSIINE